MEVGRSGWVSGCLGGCLSGCLNGCLSGCLRKNEGIMQCKPLPPHSQAEGTLVH